MMKSLKGCERREKRSFIEKSNFDLSLLMKKQLRKRLKDFRRKKKNVREDLIFK